MHIFQLFNLSAHFLKINCIAFKHDSHKIVPKPNCVTFSFSLSLYMHKSALYMRDENKIVM